jgi:molybdenum cofactor guanylyltransferase
VAAGCWRRVISDSQWNRRSGTYPLSLNTKSWPVCRYCVGVPGVITNPVAGVVLCGGHSRRMGIDKATLRLDGATLVQHVVARLRLVCDPIMIAAGDRDVGMRGCLAIDDAAPDAGPIAGVLAALRASPHGLVAIVAVDMPWVDPALIAVLAARCAGHEAAVPLSEHGPEPLHAVYARSAAGACEAAIAGEDRSLRGLLARLRVAYVSPAEWRAAGIESGFARNLNTPDDVAAFSRSRR